MWGALAGVLLYGVAFILVRGILRRGAILFITVLLAGGVILFSLLLPEPDKYRRLDVAFKRSAAKKESGRAVEKHSLNHESRRCVPARFGDSFTMPVPGQGRIYFGVGLPRIPFAEGKFTLDVFYVHDSGRREQLASKEYGLQRSNWHDLYIDVPPGYTGRAIVLQGYFSDPADNSRVPASYRFYLTDPHLVKSSDRPDVIIALVDTLRADHVGAIGGPEDVTPCLDRLASRGLVFTRAFSQSSFTPPSVASMFTSRVPHQLGLKKQNYLPEKAYTMAERFREHGYITGAVSSNWIISPESNFDQGFDSFVLHPEPLRSYYGRSAAWVTDEAIDWLSKEDRSPAFLYLHYSDPHIPYLAPLGHMVDHSQLGFSDYFRLLPAEVSLAAYLNAPFIGKFKSSLAMKESYLNAYKSLYSAEVRYWDNEFDRLLKYLAKSGRMDQTLLIITSDHGEEFLEHGFYLHGFTLYNEVIHVPLVLSGPNLPGRRVDRVVQLADIFPTLEDMLGWEKTSDVTGRSLLNLLQGKQWEDRAYSHLYPLKSSPAISVELPSYYDDRPMSCFSMINGQWKIIEYRHNNTGKRQYKLYNLAQDFNEQEDLSRKSPRRLERQKRIFHNYLEGLPHAVPPEERKISPELVETIRSLGYLQD